MLTLCYAKYFCDDDDDVGDNMNLMMMIPVTI